MHVLKASGLRHCKEGVDDLLSFNHSCALEPLHSLWYRCVVTLSQEVLS